jgi:hypothetical protein
MKVCTHSKKPELLVQPFFLFLLLISLLIIICFNCPVTFKRNLQISRINGTSLPIILVGYGNYDVKSDINFMKIAVYMNNHFI